MLFRQRGVLALACVCLFISCAFAGVLGPVRRQDVASTTGKSEGSKTSESAFKPTAAPSLAANRTTASSTSFASSLAPTSSSSSLNDALFNITIPDDQLPLEPRVTPGWAVAGVILLCSGVVYSLIGIKTQWLHTFFSTAYLCSLGTTVLILYVMTPPISEGIQGAYVVAVVLTGAILGGIAVVFKEITECLGCLLGGFCLSMWLLSLQAGGLLPALGAKVALIAAFCLATFLLYFSRYTRTYALIGCTSFSGATAAVLGIDAFSRAGLKEFWAYIWDLNENLFPLGAVTYPLTKGIRVEIAITVIIFLAGIVSQLKLWILIKKHREQRDTDRRKAQQNLEEEEARVGRDVEEANAAERRRWEAVYGDESPDQLRVKHPNPSSDSGVGDLRSEKRVRTSHGGTTSSKSSPQSESVMEEPIEMSDLASEGAPPEVPPKTKSAADMVMTHDKEGGIVTVRVAADDVPYATASPGAAVVTVVAAAVSEQIEPPKPTLRRTSKRISSSPSSPGPVVVPLPFKVPVSHEIAEEKDDRSSVAALVDDEDTAIDRTTDVSGGVNRSASVATSKRSSLAKRLSQGSADLLRSLSQRSKRSASELSRQQPSESREGLVESRSTFCDDRSSVAATMDGMSSDEEEDDAITVRDDGDRDRPQSIEIKAALASERSSMQQQPQGSLAAPSQSRAEQRPFSTAETVSTDILNVGEAPASTPEQQGLQEAASNTSPEAAAADGRSSADGSEKTPKKTKASSAASTDSTPVALTMDRLPRSLSRIAMSYRTNEWAKHLSNAETPELDELQLGRSEGGASANSGGGDSPSSSADAADAAGVEVKAAEGDERPAPVRIYELQQTAENARLPPAIASRPASYRQQLYQQQQLTQPQTWPEQPSSSVSRSNSRQSLGAAASAAAAGQEGTAGGQTRNPYRRSASALRRVSGPVVHGVVTRDAIVEEAAAMMMPVAPPSSTPSPTLDEGGGPGSASGSVSGGRTSVSPSPTPGVVVDMHQHQHQQQRTASSLSVNRPPVPGVVSYSSPQTLIGKRDMFLRHKSTFGPVAAVAPEHMPTIHSRPPSEAAFSPSPYVSAPASPVAIDVDDMPLSKRRELMMRQQSLLSLQSGAPGAPPLDSPVSQLGAAPGRRSTSSASGGDRYAASPVPAATSAEALPFNSHQPQRGLAPHVQTPAAREAQLAAFRSSVAADLRASASTSTVNLNPSSGRETPSLGMPMQIGAAAAKEAAAAEAVLHNIEMQRSALLGRKEAEASRREAERVGKERADRAFDEMMRRSDMLDAHRDAMRRMQAGARDDGF